VGEIQRARIIAAMAEVACEHGAGNVTVAHVVARAGVSRRTFYALFDDREDCFLAAFDRAIEEVAARVVSVYRQPGAWKERIRESLAVLLEFLDDEPYLGRLLTMETLGAGPAVLDRRQRVLALIVTAIDEGRDESKQRGGPPSLAAEGVVGAVFSIIHTRLSELRPSPLIELLSPLMGMIVLPYLGPAQAAKEIQREARKASGKSRTGLGNPLKDLEMRLTYRTVRVLMAIGSHPGVSNRRVGDESGITDQGQISKLLARLDHLGLIENSGFGQAKGESNSWYLTPRGQSIEQAIREQTKQH
jgi:AcrR family transcriptional regulator